MGVATLDSDHEKTRQRIRNETSGSGLSTFKAGVKGFGHGLWGGLSSVVTQTYTGAREDGVEVSISCSHYFTTLSFLTSGNCLMYDTISLNKTEFASLL